MSVLLDPLTLVSCAMISNAEAAVSRLLSCNGNGISGRTV